MFCGFGEQTTLPPPSFVAIGWASIVCVRAGSRQLSSHQQYIMQRLKEMYTGSGFTFDTVLV